MTLKFGTDGVRGVANSELTPELVLGLGRAAARVLGATSFVVGRDTRRSGGLIQAALSAGLAAEGADVADLGVLPTPGVAYAAATREVAGAVISASHNPFADNGVKFFAPGGRKLSDEVEERLEAELARILGGLEAGARTGAEVGAVHADPSGAQAYEDHLVSGVLEGRGLDGLRIVLDCANGAATTVGPNVMRRLGAEVMVIGDAPDGTNINDGFGSTAPERLQRSVLDYHADLGLAFDGDADRLIAVDAAGQLVDGDHIIAIAAVDLHQRGLLRDNAVVVTVMTNLGFRLAMDGLGISVVETQVGDRYVLEALAAGRLSLGGEQSGHVIFNDFATTGDGILTGVVLADIVNRRHLPLATLAEVMTRLPQVLVNVKVARRDPDIADAIAADIAAVEADLGDHGRVLVRPSGTEPVVRVMVEAPTHEQAAAAADRLVVALRRVSG